MNNDERFLQNIERWGHYRLEAATLVAGISNPEVQFCQAESGAANLCKIVEGQPYFYHSNIDPEEEAVLWFSECSSTHIETLFIYGIGLGYYYKAARAWLKENERRSLIFIEDDPHVIRRFFETDTAYDFLRDRQVFLDYLPDDPNFIANLEGLTLVYSFRKFNVSALRSYSQGSRYAKLRRLIEFYSVTAKNVTSEYMIGSPSFYRNFFANLLDIFHAFQTDKMQGKFIGIPAIICGAGPSLSKNIDLIGSLKNRALIFAGGSALNALNSHGIDPHFGLGVDPNPTQITRLISNQAYETPFFYRTRMRHEALNLVHGDKIFVSKNGGHQISEWFEKKLGIDGYDVPQGYNVLNLSLSLAQFLGCNPILVAGADLAYSQGESYATGVVNHPIHDLKSDFRTKNFEDELVRRKDIYGNTVETTWKWIIESLWYYQIAEKMPNTSIVNVTEGGIGFPHITNMTLKEAADLFLPPASDLHARVLGAIHNSTMPPSANLTNLLEWIGKFLESLEQCTLHCANIIEILDKLHSQMGQKEGAFSDPDKNLIQEWEKEEEKLIKEDAYINELTDYNSAYIRAAAIEFQRLLFDKGIKKDEEIKLRKLSIDSSRYNFLKNIIDVHKEIIKKCLEEHAEMQALQLKWLQEGGENACETLRKQYPLPQPNKEDTYTYEDGKITIIDKELGISLAETISPNSVQEQVVLKYSSGTSQLVSSYKDAVLHGPSIAYAEDGQELVRSWFWNGKRQGKLWSYYKSGHLHSLQRFLDGILEGNQQFFYEDGLPKTIMTYSHGQLNGDVHLWHRNGRKARQLHFVQGKRHGEEKFWDSQGVLRIEAQYQHGNPVGLAKIWNDQGELEKEIEYDELSLRTEVRVKDESGNLSATKEVKKNDYFDDVTDQVLKLTGSIDVIYRQMTEIVPLVNSRQNPQAEQLPPEMSADMEELKQEMQRLQSLAEHLKKEASMGQGRHDETLWKSPSTQHKLEKQIESLGNFMNKSISDIQGGLKNLSKKIQEKENKEP